MEKMKARKGLEGVIVDESSVSKVMPEINALVYYGYPVQDLAENCSFEEVAYLLLNGELPNQTELSSFIQNEKTYRTISDKLKTLIKLFNNKCHPMDSLKTAVSFLGTEDSDAGSLSRESNYIKSIKLLAKIPIIVAADFRSRQGKNIIDPRNDLSIAENFFYMCFNEVPNEYVIKAFDVSMILYAEHTFNASTFTARVVISSLSDIYSAVTGAIGSLKGPLHGGANEAVMHTMKEINDPNNAKAWLETALKNNTKIMGFGHRVYKKGDSRVPTMQKYMLKMAEIKGQDKWAKIYHILKDHMLKEKNIHPNLDFPTGPAYYMMGFNIETFTPIFVISRITGWTAHIMEQLKDNRLIRPLSQYIGPNERKVMPINKR